MLKVTNLIYLLQTRYRLLCLSRISLILFSLLVSWACDDDTESTPMVTAGEIGTDGLILDMQEELLADEGLDMTLADMNLIDMRMAGEEFDQNFFPDAEVDLDASLPTPECEFNDPPELEVNLEQKKFALSMFHFNLEYVIGGLYYDDDQGQRQYILNNPSIGEGWDNDRLEDWIITETFNPILELYEAHADWTVTIELQGYMLEVIAQRHPEILERFRRLAQTGQVEVVSFHYAAQLFLAFPKEDLVRSIRKTKQIFADYCIPLSGVVFNQEGQAGPGRQQVLLEEGYQIGVFPKNLFRYAQGEIERWPYYLHEEGDLIVGPTSYDPQSGIEVNWTFFDDGELRAVREAVNPYSAPLGGRDQARLDEYEAQVQNLADQGYQVSSITNYVKHLKAQEVPQPEAPALVDGTWQPPSTDSIHRWLGGRSQFFVGEEEDIRIRSGNMRARTAAAAIQVLFDEIQAQDLLDDQDWVARMDRLWRNVWHSQVSDFTGVNPWRGEIEYGLRMNRWIMNETNYLKEQFLTALDWSYVEIDLKEKQAMQRSALPEELTLQPLNEEPLSVNILTPGRQVETEWYEVAESHYLLDLHISEQIDMTDEQGQEIDGAEISVFFPRSEDVLEYSPGLIEDEVYRHDLSEFTLLLDHLYLPLPNGLIGLGNGWYVIKDCRMNHVAGRITPEPTIDFVDRAVQRNAAARWQFHLVQAEPHVALEIANRLNIYPTVYYAR